MERYWAQTPAASLLAEMALRSRLDRICHCHLLVVSLAERLTRTGDRPPAALSIGCAQTSLVLSSLFLWSSRKRVKKIKSMRSLALDDFARDPRKLARTGVVDHHDRRLRY